MRLAAIAYYLAMVLVILSTIGTAWCTETGQDVIVSFKPTDLPSVMSKDAAVELAVRYSGLPPGSIVSVNYGMLTDTSIPYFGVVDRTAWEVVFDAVELQTTGRDGTKYTNRNIGRLTAVIDDKTGSLLKVSSPKPAEEGIKLLTGKYAQSEIGSMGGVLEMTTIKPELDFLQAFATGGREALIGSLQAKELAAYYGLFSEPPRIGVDVKSRPYWIIVLGGIKLPLPSGGYSIDPRPTYIGTEGMIVMDAGTGIVRIVKLLGQATPPE